MSGPGNRQWSGGVNILIGTVQAGGLRHEFYFLYDNSPASAATLQTILGQYADDPGLPMTWEDAGRLAESVRAARDRK